MSEYINPSDCPHSIHIEVHYNSNWQYHDASETTGGFGPHEMFLVKNYDKLCCRIPIVTYDELDPSVPYTIQKGPYIPYMGRTFNLMLDRIVEIFNQKERTYETFYNLYVQICHCIKDCVFIEKVVLYTYSSMLNYSAIRKIKPNCQIENINLN